MLARDANGFFRNKVTTEQGKAREPKPTMPIWSCLRLWKGSHFAHPIELTPDIRVFVLEKGALVSREE